MNRADFYRFVGSVEAAHVGLMLWLLAGKVWVLGWGSIPLPEIDSEVVKAGWLFTGFAAPLMVISAYGLIRWATGRWRYIAFWLRLGGDVSQISIMSIFVINLLGHAFGTLNSDHDHHIFTSFFVGALLTFLGAMVVRDVLTIMVTERLAGKIQRDGMR